MSPQKNFRVYADCYRQNLLHHVIPFWEKNSPDTEFGGYFTCLDADGKVYDTDKFVWLQSRQVWTFSMLYNEVEQKPEWLDFAVQGAEFLSRNGRDAEGNWYFSLTREGKPLVQPYNIFSDCFAAMAFAQAYKASKNELHKDIAVKTFDNILKRKANPKGKYDKNFPGTRPLQGFSLPMILCNLVLELEHVIDPALVENLVREGIHSVMEVFYQEGSGLILEHVSPTGDFVDSFEGRLLNPGHALEAMWFIMDIAARSGDGALIKKATAITLNTLEYGWDREYGGLFYFLDIKKHPPQQLEWDRKLWWVHIEAMVALLKGYLHTRDERCWQWFEKLHHYTWDHFVDMEKGEWFGYLDRQGQVLMPLKGGKWKGCFHVPRGLFQGWKTLQAIEAKYENLIHTVK